MAMHRVTKREEGNNNIFWTTMADLLLGLAIIFMVLFVLAISGMTRDTIRASQTKAEISQKLGEEFKKHNLDVKVNPTTGDVGISDAQLFEVGSYKLSEKGKKYLDAFMPVYFDCIFSKEEFIDFITGVIVQGHTDSQQYAKLNSVDEQYLRNMELSLQRANAVASYIFKTKFDRQYAETIRKKLVVEGKSFSEPVLVNGVEDYAQSRRVVLKLKLKNFDILSQLGFGLE
ncbi:OmpA family protein [bacterium]|nr:OmpA family protein [bacterium]